jgi:hypothetical protein
VHTEHLFISWYAVLDVGLKLDAEDYEDKEEYVQYVHCTVAQKTVPMFFYFKEIGLQHNTITLAYSVKNVYTSILS